MPWKEAWFDRRRAQRADDRFAGDGQVDAGGAAADDPAEPGSQAVDAVRWRDTTRRSRDERRTLQAFPRVGMLTEGTGHASPAFIGPVVVVRAPARPRLG